MYRTVQSEPNDTRALAILFSQTMHIFLQMFPPFTGKNASNTNPYNRNDDESSGTYGNSSIQNSNDSLASHNSQPRPPSNWNPLQIYKDPLASKYKISRLPNISEDVYVVNSIVQSPFSQWLGLDGDVRTKYMPEEFNKRLKCYLEMWQYIDADQKISDETTSIQDCFQDAFLEGFGKCLEKLEEEVEEEHLKVISKYTAINRLASFANGLLRFLGVEGLSLVIPFVPILKFGGFCKQAWECIFTNYTHNLIKKRITSREVELFFEVVRSIDEDHSFFERFTVEKLTEANSFLKNLPEEEEVSVMMQDEGGVMEDSSEEWSALMQCSELMKDFTDIVKMEKEKCTHKVESERSYKLEFFNMAFTMGKSFMPYPYIWKDGSKRFCLSVVDYLIERAIAGTALTEEEQGDMLKMIKYIRQGEVWYGMFPNRRIEEYRKFLHAQDVLADLKFEINDLREGWEKANDKKKAEGNQKKKKLNE